MSALLQTWFLYVTASSLKQVKCLAGYLPRHTFYWLIFQVLLIVYFFFEPCDCGEKTPQLFIKTKKVCTKQKKKGEKRKG
jgi:hypothetical protein